MNVVETTAILNQIVAIQKGKSFENLMGEYKDLLLNNELHANDGNKGKNIGPQDNAKRICRYYHRDSSEQRLAKSLILFLKDFEIMESLRMMSVMNVIVI